jgi:hypothetical protein
MRIATKLAIGILAWLPFAHTVIGQTRYIREPIIECYCDPIPLSQNQRTILIYELHITNVTRELLELQRIVVSNASIDHADPLQVVQGETLASNIKQFGVEKGYAETQVVRGGFRAVVFMRLEFEQDASVPSQLRHDISYEISDIENLVVDHSTEFTVSVSQKKPIVLGPPVGDGLWLCSGTPERHHSTGHRGSFRTSEGRLGDRARYAIDFVGMSESGSVLAAPKVSVNLPDPAALVASSLKPTSEPHSHSLSEGLIKIELPLERGEGFVGYGAEILAVADGTVVSVLDGIPDNEKPLPGVRSVPMNTFENVGGNNIVLDIGAGNYASYSHLKHGSIRVMKGDAVKQGQVLALLGNSGNSDGPHLHFHITDAKTWGGEGQPFVLEEYRYHGTFTPAEKWTPSTAPTTKQMEMPGEAAVISFSE